MERLLQYCFDRQTNLLPDGKLLPNVSFADLSVSRDLRAKKHKCWVLSHIRMVVNVIQKENSMCQTQQIKKKHAVRIRAVLDKFGSNVSVN